VGHEKGDGCYYRPDQFSEGFRGYFEELQKLSPGPWCPIRSFEEVDASSQFPLAKYLGSLPCLCSLQEKLRSLDSVQVSLIQNPPNPFCSLLLITHREAHKGAIVEYLKEEGLISSPVIVAGNDFNDLPLLRAGEVKISMEDAPEELRAAADILAPSSLEKGIIPALEKAIRMVDPSWGLSL